MHQFFRMLVFLVSFAFLSVNPSSSETTELPVDEGMDWLAVALRELPEEERTALAKESLPAAESGDARAQFIVSVMYFWGIGLPRDQAQVAFWVQKSAAQSFVPAQELLGLLLLHGQEGLEANPERAIELLKISAAEGLVSSQFYLGEFYRMGEIVEKDEARAAKWLQKAAEQGFSTAQFSYAKMLRDGIGVEADKAASVDWFRQAAKQDYRHAMYELAQAYRNGVGVDVDLEKSLVWLKLAADQNIENAREIWEQQKAVSDPAIIRNVNRAADNCVATDFVNCD